MSTPGAVPPAAEATRGILGRGSLYTLATAAPALTAIAVLPVVTRSLPVAEYGVVAVVLVVQQVGMILLGLGLGASVTRTAIIEAGGRARAATLALQAAVLAVVLAAVLLLAGPLWSTALLGVPWSAASAWAVGAAAVGSTVVVLQSWMRGLDRVGRYVLLGVLANLGGPVLGLVLVLAVAPQAQLYALGLAVGQLVAAGLGLVDVLKSERAPATWRGLRAGLRIGLPTLPHQVSLYLAVGGLVLVATHALGTAGGGRANVVLTLGVGAAVLVSAMNNAWAPAVYRVAPEDRPAVLDDSTRRIGLLATLVAGAVALAGPWLLRVLAPTSYRPEGLVAALAVVTAATLLSVVYLASGHLVFASGRTTALALTTPVSVTAGLGIAAALTPVVGPVGLGVGYVAVYLLLAVATTAVQRRVSETPWWPPPMPVALTLAVGVTVGGALLPVTGAGAVVRAVAAVAALAGAGAVVLQGLRPARAA